MAEAIAIIGLVSSIVQFIEFGTKVVKRLNNYRSSFNKIPKAFQDIHTQLPLLLSTLNRTKEEAETGDLDVETENSVLPVVNECWKKIQKLDSLLSRILQHEGDSALRRGQKAIASLSVEKEVESITSSLQRYVQVLTYHQVTGPRVIDLTDRTRKKPFFEVPFSRDAGFIGRASILDSIDSAFQKPGRLALCGIGGVGKSQTAIESCYRYQHLHPDHHVFWVHCSSNSRFELAYKTIARRLELPDLDNGSVDVLELVVEWFNDEANGSWLLVLDNVDDIEFFFPQKVAPSSASTGRRFLRYLPKESAGRMLITSRNIRVGARLAGKDNNIDLHELDHDEALQLLHHRLSSAGESASEELTKIIGTLGNLPLAITQAAAFMSETGIGAEEYLNILDSGDIDLVDLLEEDHGDTRRDFDSLSSVSRTLRLSFDNIMTQKPKAAELLSLMALLDRQGIPRFLLESHGGHKLEFLTALSTLQAFSFISGKATDDSFEMHRLVQICVRKWLGELGTLSTFEERALKAVEERFPYPDYEQWKTCQLLMPHVLTVTKYNMSSSQGREAHGELQRLLGCYLLSQGKYSQAKVEIQESLDIYSSLGMKEDRSVLIAKYHLARVLGANREYSGAVGLLKEVFDIQMKEMGEEDHFTIVLGNELASNYYLQGLLTEAEELQEKILISCKKIYGEGSRETISIMNNLASTYDKQGRLGEAEARKSHVIEANREILGEDHPDTLATMVDLAGIFDLQGRYSESESLYLRAVQMQEKIFGEDHPHTFSTMGHLAALYIRQGRLHEAEGLLRDLLPMCTSVRGRDDYETMNAGYNLGSCCYGLGKFKEAEQIYRDVFNRERRVLGENDIATLASLRFLGLAVLAQGRFEEAEILINEAYEKRRRVQGENDPETLKLEQDLADVRERIRSDESALIRAGDEDNGSCSDETRTLETETA